MTTNTCPVCGANPVECCDGPWANQQCPSCESVQWWRLGVSTQTILRRVAEGRIPALNVAPTASNPQYRYDYNEVLAALAKTGQEGK